VGERGKAETLKAEMGRLLVAHANGQENAHPDFVLENGARIEEGWRGLL
jgi:uncharacterized protein (DUF736 family)